MINKNQYSKEYLDPGSQKCLVCNRYLRTINEIQQNLSGRDTIINVLQEQLKKIETNYKALLDEFEKLRFEHCTAIHDNLSLKEINAKLEECSVKSIANINSFHKNTVQNNLKRFCQGCQNNKCVNREQNGDIFDEVEHIESLVNNQNKTLRQLLEKVLQELKFCKCNNPNFKEDIQRLQEKFETIDNEDFSSKKDERLKALLHELQKLKCENDSMKQTIMKKSSNLSNCACVLEDNKMNINNISKSIDDIIKEKDFQIKALQQYNKDGVETMEKCIQLDNKESDLMNCKCRLKELEFEVKEKELLFNICKCQLTEQINDIANNNQVLSDTLVVMTEENKSNVEAVTSLKGELKNVNKEYEKSEYEMKHRITELENELEDSRRKEQTLREAIDNWDKEKMELKERLKHVIEENSNLRECRCEDNVDLRLKIAELETITEDMRKELTEKTLELTEYEEDHRGKDQKMEILMKQSSDLRERVRYLENELYERDNRKVTTMDKVSQAEIRAKESEKCTGKCNTNNTLVECRCQKVQEELNSKNELINSLTSSVKSQINEIQDLGKENEDLREQIHNQSYNLENKLYERDNKKGIREDKYIQAEGGKKESENFSEKKLLECRCQKVQEELNSKNEVIHSLTCSIKCQINEIQDLGKENEDLRRQIEQMRNENSREVDKLQGIVNQSQQQVTMLLNEHDEKTAEIQGVATELERIRRSVTDENNCFTMRIGQIEMEKDALKKELEESKKNLKECRCQDSQREIERIKGEVIKKQCVIVELEKSVDNFNRTMTNFEQNIQELVGENEILIRNQEKSMRDKERLEVEIESKLREIAKLRDELNKINNKCNNCVNQSNKVDEQNNILREEIKKLKCNTDNAQRESNAINLGLQMEIENLKRDQEKICSQASEQMRMIHEKHEDLKQKYTQQCFECDQLRQERKKHKDSFVEVERNRCILTDENEKLKKEITEHGKLQSKYSEDIGALKSAKYKLKTDLACKCAENEDLKSEFDRLKKQLATCSDECKDLRRTKIENEKEIFDLSEKYRKILQSYEQKDAEFKKLKKQWDSCCKQSQITREEYNNLRKEYKEIKAMLSDQIKKYRNDTGGLEATSPNKKPCQIVQDLKNKLIEKEQQITMLQQKLKDASYEIIELKDYIHKLISDNNILKSAINNLIGNLERKIKGPSFQNLPSNSAEVIAGEILQSLTDIETHITKKCHSCPIKECNCMSEIFSQYSMRDTDQGPSKITRQENSDCWKRSFNENKTCTANKSIGRDNTDNKILIESSTTDSDDCHCDSFLDKRSVEFLKEAIQDLKSKKDSTMKEKSCDCERSMFQK